MILPHISEDGNIRAPAGSTPLGVHRRAILGQHSAFMRVYGEPTERSGLMFAHVTLTALAAPAVSLCDLVDDPDFHETLKLHSKWRSVGAFRRTAAMSRGQRSR